MAVFSLKDTTIKIKGGGVAEEVEIKVGDGNISWTESRELEYLKDRGQLDAVEETEENPVEVEFTIRWEFFRVVGSITPYDALTHQNDAANWATTDQVDPCGPKSVDIEIAWLPACDTEDQEIYTLQAFRYTSINPSGTDRQISVSGSCNVRHVSAARAARP